MTASVVLRVEDLERVAVRKPENGETVFAAPALEAELLFGERNHLEPRPSRPEPDDALRLRRAETKLRRRGAEDQGRHCETGSRRARPRREDHRAGVARRRHGGHLHRSPPDARADRRDGDPGRRGRRRDLDPLRRAHDARAPHPRRAEGERRRRRARRRRGDDPARGLRRAEAARRRRGVRARRRDERDRRLPQREGAGQLIHVGRDAAVAILTVDRQEALNALDVETLTELRDRLQDVAGDDDVRAVILTGAGEKAFAAGADIKYMSGLDVEQAKAWGALGHEAGRLLETMPKPTIAAVNGFALGGGCELALACDIRYAASNAKLGQPEVNLGIIPGWGGTQRLARVCGLGVAKELIFTGRVVGADEALRIGLVNAVHDPVLDKALETAALLASKSPIALRVMKQLANRALGGDYAANLEAEGESFGELFSSDDAKEGMTAFVESRTSHRS